MVGTDSSDSDFDEQELESLNQENVNKIIRETTIRKPIPVQRDLTGQIIGGQTAVYEEIIQEISFGPTHHSLNQGALEYYVYPTNFEVRDYQFDIVRKSLFQNILCAIPTGMGKTFIASAVMLNFFRWADSGKIIFTAPTRPLVAQQIKACLGITGIPQNQTAILLDKSRRNREEIWGQKRVFFTTPQVVENDLKRGVLHPKDIVCIVFDEAHRATGSYAYTNIIKFISRFNTSFRVLALTATPGTDLMAVQEVVNNLSISNIEARTEESIDIARYMKKRSKVKIEVGLSSEIEELIEQIGIAIMPALKQAVELNIYEECDPSQINAFKAMQQSQKIVANPSIPEGVKWRNFFILQLLNHVGQMLKRIKIYGIRTFYSYFIDKYKEFTTKYSLRKSTNKTAAEFYYNPILTTLNQRCEKMLSDPQFLGHDKLHHVREELTKFFSNGKSDSRVIIFTELRESALEIVKCVDNMNDLYHSHEVRPHIFIGQARSKGGFDEVVFTRKNQPKGRKKTDRLKRQEEDKMLDEERKLRKKREQSERDARRTGSSEDAQLNGMTQKQQKEVIHKFKSGEYNVLVCTSIGEEGLDIGEVDLIICYDSTSSPIKNIQRMGRTGRKRDGRIVLLFSSNESFKFEQAMKDYSSLQKLICHNYLQYHKSDRILPACIEPICRKEHIVIDEEAQEVNKMEDSEEVIRYATQCMLGKKPKTKRKAKQKTAKKEKRFFMPDNIDAEIVTADTLLRKSVSHEVPASEGSSLKREFPVLDNIEFDSSNSSSPIKPNYDIHERHGLKFHEVETTAQPQPSTAVINVKPETGVKLELPSLERTTSDLIENTSLGHKIDDDDKRNDTPNAKKRKANHLEETTFIDRKKSIRSKEKTVSNAPETRGGLLTRQEREYFLKHYSAAHTVSIDTIPNFQQYVKTSKVNHSIRNQKILKLFEDLRFRNKTRTIEMNRTKCIARGIQSGVVQAESQDVSIIVKNDVITGSRHSFTKNPAVYLATSPAELDELLASDSDF